MEQEERELFKQWEEVFKLARNQNARITIH